jgi:peptide/nickel transport system substrate-binding protein
MQQSLSRRQLLAGVAGGTTALAAGCQSIFASENAGGSKTVALSTPLTGGDWSMYGGAAPYYSPMHETLTASSHDFSTIEPWLATEWETVDDTAWEFTLRDGVTFHNGETLTADLVAHSLSALLGDRPLSWAKITDESFTAVDDRTLRIETVERFGALAGTLSHPLFGIQHPDSYDRPIGTGSFEAESVEPDSPLQTVRFGDYWGAEPQLAELTFEGITDPTTRSTSLQAGEIDASFEIPRQDYELLSANDAVQVRTQREPRAGSAMINLYNSPTDDADLRRALNYAVDQQSIVDSILSGIGTPAKGPYPPMIPFSAHDELPEYGPNLERARDLVDQSGYGGEDVELHVSSNTPHMQLIATRMQDRFAEIGVSSTVRQFDRGSFFETEQMAESNLTLIELGSINGAADYLVHLQFHSEGGDNRALYESEGTGLYNLGPEVDSLIEEGDRALDEETKHEAYREVQRRVMDQGVLVPIYYKEYVLGQRANTTGPETHAVPHMTRWTEFAHDGQ